MAAKAAAEMRRNREFPTTGRAWDDLKAEMLAAHAGDNPWCHERSFAAAYFAGEDVLCCAHEAYDAYRDENGLFAASAYPSLAACERALVAGVLDLLHAPDGAGGSTTAGGTESILMAMKAARDWAREHRPVASVPEVVVPKTAHAAFDKGAEWLGMKVVRMGRSEDWRADVAGMADAITENTVMIAGSAPPYPYGETDPIEEIAQLAQAHDLWMHSDGCIGGMILPFMKALGEPIPPFDFAVPGVTSMSVDMHKFGYAHKGISLCLLRDRAAGTLPPHHLRRLARRHLLDAHHYRHPLRRRGRQRLGGDDPSGGGGLSPNLRGPAPHPRAPGGWDRRDRGSRRTRAPARAPRHLLCRGLRHLRGRRGDGGARLALDPHARAGLDPALAQHEARGQHRRLPRDLAEVTAEVRHGGLTASAARRLELCDLERDRRRSRP